MGKLPKLFHYMNRVWAMDPKVQTVLQVDKGSGPHEYITLINGTLAFHSTPYHASLVEKQVLVLEDLSWQDLRNRLTGMGYVVRVTSEGQRHLTDAALLMVPVRNASVTVRDGYIFETITSTTWGILYPIARLLETLELDTALAMQQVYLHSAKGKWLDYWASFFNVRRYINEQDAALLKRILLLLVNPKTNNRAIEEIIKLTMGIDAEVRDVVPSVFQIILNLSDLTEENTRKINSLLAKLKAGGVDYYINHDDVDFLGNKEDYGLHLWDTAGITKPFMDNGNPTIHVTMTYDEPQYKPVEPVFRLNTPTARLNEEGKLVGVSRVDEEFTMHTEDLPEGVVIPVTWAPHTERYNASTIDAQAPSMFGTTHTMTFNEQVNWKKPSSSNQDTLTTAYTHRLGNIITHLV